METYQAFGLIFKSGILLPSLPPSRSENPDVEITLGPVEKAGLTDPIHLGRFAQSKPDELWMHVPGVAWFHVTGGNRVTVNPEEGADEQSIRLYLLGSCIGAIVHQRGQLILHGSALRFGDQCVVFAGNSGVGKSTLAAGLHIRGHDILSDDLAVIDRHGNVQPGIPQIKLWSDATRRLSLDTGAMIRIRMQVEKFAYPVGKGFCDQPLPLAAVYILHTHNKPDIVFEPVNGMGKFSPLKNHTYRSQHIKGLGMQTRHLQLCGQVANRIRLTHITRPSAGFTLDELIERVEVDVNSYAQPSLAPA